MSIDQNDEFLESVLQTLDFIHQIVNYIQSTPQTYSLDQFFAEIQATALSGIKSSSTYVKKSEYGTVIPTSDQERLSMTVYWEGVLEAVKLSRKKWFELMDTKKFLSFIENFRSILTKDIGVKAPITDLLEGFFGYEPEPSDPRRKEPSPTPFIYYFPFPKGPPAASAEAELKTKRLINSNHSSNFDQSPLYQKFLSSPFFKEFLPEDDE